jgi:hypothetical protein
MRLREGLWRRHVTRLRMLVHAVERTLRLCRDGGKAKSETGPNKLRNQFFRHPRLSVPTRLVNRCHPEGARPAAETFRLHGGA